MSTSTATDDTTPCLGTCSKGVWFTYTPDCSGTATVTTCGSAFDTKLEVFSGSCGALSSIGCNDDSSCGVQSTFSFTCTAGATYYICAGGKSGASGNLQIKASRVCPSLPTPANDQCSGAFVLSENTPYAMSTLTATDDSTPCLGTCSKGVWFTYTPSVSGTATVTTCGSDFDTKIEIFSGACGALSSIGCNDDSTCGLQSTFSFACVAGATYRICAGGYGGAGGNLRIVANAASSGLANDTCSGAIALPENITYTMDTHAATDDTTPCLGTCYKGVWFTYTPDCTGTATVMTCGSGFDTKLEVFSGVCGALTSVGCNDDSCGLQSVVTFPCTAGTTYRICAGGYGGASGTLLILASRVCAGTVPLNDRCSGAIALANGVPATLNTSGATAAGDPTPSCGSDVDKGVWYKVTPNISGSVTVGTCNSDFDTVMAVYDGSCGALNEIDCNDDGCGVQSTITFSANAGTTYYVFVGGYAGDSGNLEIMAEWTSSTPTKIIGLSGSLAMGNVQVGLIATRTLTINNLGTAALTVTGISYPSGFSGAWSGTIPAGGSQNVTVTFRPTAIASYGGTVTVNSDAASGTGTTSASGTGASSGGGGTVTATDGDWTAQHVELVSTPEAAFMARMGDIDNLNFGWPAGFNPFSGNSTPVHSFPWTVDPTDALGTDRIMVLTSYGTKAVPCGRDGYTGTTTRPGNNVQTLTLTYSLPAITVSNAVLQLFVDDFQAPVWCANYQVTINGRRASFLEAVINSLIQTGPIGKLITVQVPTSFLNEVTSGSLAIKIDDTTTGAGDGYAIDFVKLLVNVNTTGMQNGTISGHVRRAGTSTAIVGAQVTCVGVTATTDSAGAYTLANVPAGLAFVQASATGFNTTNQFATVIAGQITANVDFTMTTNTTAGSGAVRPDVGFTTGGQLAANDDSYTSSAMPIGFSINYYGTNFSSVFVNNNGNVTFDHGYSTYTPYGISNVVAYIMAPFFADVDTRATNSQVVTWGNSTVNGHNAFGVNWVNVGYYSSHGDKLNKFQLVLIDRSDTGAGNFDMEFNYDYVLWETGDASGGSSGFGGKSAAVGFSNGSLLPGTYYQMPGSLVPGSFLDTNAVTGLVHGQQNSGVLGRYVWSVRSGYAMLTIQAQSLPTGSVGTVYAPQTMHASGGSGTYTSWTIAAGSLPPGLNLNNSGIISGTPTTSGTFTFTVQVTDSLSATAQQSFTIAVTGAGTSGAVRPDAGFITGGSLPANDDDYTAAAIPLGFTINFYGTSFSELYVNNNGNATLDQGYPDYTPFGIAGVSNVYIMAPFFADVDTTANSSIVTWGTSTVNGHAAFGVNWVNVNHYDSTANTGAALNSFQLVLIDRSDTGAGNFDMEFNYDRILWETGDADGGTNGLGGISATIGFSNGSGTPGTYYQMPGSMVPGSFLDGNPTTGLVHGQQNSGGVLGRYVWRVRNGNALTIQTTTLPAGTVGASYGSQTLQATGGTTPYIWTVAAGSLPPGLNLSSGGVLSGTPTGAGGSYTFTVQVADNAGGTAQQSYTVTINACNYTIATSASPAGGGTARGGIVNCGSPITVTATANPCYSFVKWTENGAQVSTSANYTFTPAANRTLIAVFAQTTYTIATSVNPSGAGTVGGSGSQPCGNTVTLTATPAAGGYYFVNWTENGAIVSTAASYSFTASGNRTLVANFGGGIMIVTPSLLPTGMVGAAYSKTLQATNGTTPYKWTVVTGSRLPTGMKLNATTGALTGKPTAPGAYTFRIRVTGANGQYAERDFTLVVITPPMAPLAGTYNGLILHATTPLFGNGGALKIVLSRTGSFAANISLGGVATAYSGQFDPTGNYQTNNLVRRGRSALQIILHLDLTGATKQITGTINDGTFTSQVLADLQYYSASNPCPWAGKYNCLLEPTVVSTTVPQGVGYGTFTVTASGSAALAGTLADGTAVSCTMPVSKWGTWPLYKLLYTNKGAAIGWLAFTSGTTLAGSVDWIKPAATSGRYLAGFNTLVNLTGVKLTPPDGPGVWHITLAGGDIGGSVLRNVTVSATGAGNVTPVDAYKLSLKVTVATGKFTGSFVHPSTGRPVSFSGLFLQAPENNAGGFFLGPNTSGAVTLEP